MTDQKVLNNQIIDQFRASREKDDVVMEGRPLLLLTVVGKKTGQRHTTPIMGIPDGDRYVVIASAAGAPTHPQWYTNLVANPEVGVEVGKEIFDATASTAEGAERQRLWDMVTAARPFFAEYQAKIERQIPVVILTRHGK